MPLNSRVEEELACLESAGYMRHLGRRYVEHMDGVAYTVFQFTTMPMLLEMLLPDRFPLERPRFRLRRYFPEHDELMVPLLQGRRVSTDVIPLIFRYIGTQIYYIDFFDALVGEWDPEVSIKWMIAMVNEWLMESGFTRRLQF